MRLSTSAVRDLVVAPVILVGLGAVDVAQAQNLPTPAPLGQITLFADRLGRALTDVQGNIAVVEAEELKQRNVRSLEDLVRGVPGIAAVRQVSGTDPFGGQPGLRIRGVDGNRVQMQIDGSRTPERIIDGSRDYFDFGFTKQVDIVRGPASVLWGADALGGVLAVETIGPDDLIPEGATRGGEVTASYGSINRGTNIAFAFAQRFGSDFAVMVARSRGVDHETTLSRARADGGIYGCSRPVAFGSVTCGQFNPLDRTSDRTLIKAQWTPSEGHSLTFVLDHLDRRSVVQNTTNLGPSGTNTNLSDTRTRDIYRTRYALEYEGQFGGLIDEVRATLSFTPSGYDQLARLTQRNALGQTINQLDYLDYSESFLELDLQATSRFDLGATQHVVTFGIDADRTKTSYDRRRTVQNVTLGTSVNSVPPGFNFTDGTTTRADIYIQNQITAFDGRLELTPGLRYATYSLDPRLNAAVVPHPDNPTTRREEQRLLKSLGATWRFNDTYSIWAKYGEGFKMPTFQQLYTSSTAGSFDLVPAPNLVPEDVRSIELGMRGEFANGFWAITGFKADYTNFIESFYFVPGTNDITYRNISQVKTHGLELEGAYRFSDRLAMTGAVAWMDGKRYAAPGAVGTQHLVPPLTANLGLTYDLPQYDLQLRANGTLAKRAKPTAANNFTPPGYGVLDLGATWNITPTAQLNLSLNNVFNKRYFDFETASRTLTPSPAVANTVPLELFTGAGRNFNLTLDVKF